jgi:hypothetical protein
VEAVVQDIIALIVQGPVLVNAHVAPKVHIKKAQDQRHAHPVPRHQTVQQEHIATHVDTQQECLTRVPVIIVQAIITVMSGPWTGAQNVEHVQVVDIEADVVWHEHLTVQAHVLIAEQARTKRAGAHSLIVTFACVTKAFKWPIVIVFPELHVSFALLASTSHMTVPRSNALTVNHVQKVNIYPAVLDQTALVPAWDVQQERTKLR